MTTRAVCLALVLVSCTSTTPEPGVSGTWSGNTSDFLADAPTTGTPWVLDIEDERGNISGAATTPDGAYAVLGTRTGNVVAIHAVRDGETVAFALNFGQNHMNGSAMITREGWPPGVAIGVRARFQRVTP